MIRRATRWATASTGSLTTHIMRGGLWLTIGQILNRTASVIKIAILGRLLSPNDFGLMGIGMLMLQWLEYFTQSGFNVVLIQQKEDPRPFYATVWTTQFLRGLGLATLLFAGAPLVATYFENQEAASISRAVAVVLLLRGITSPAVITLRRNMDFRTETLWRLSGTLAGLISSIPLAFYLRNAWALVLSLIIGQAVETLVSFWVEPFRPRFSLERQRAQKLFTVGKWVFFNNVLSFVGNYADSMVVGRVLGVSSLGVYQIASQLALLPANQVGVYLRGLMLPAFSKVEGREAQCAAFMRSFSLLAGLMLPFGCFVSVFAKPIVLLILGPQWHEAVPLARLLVWSGILNALWEIGTAMVFRLGEPQNTTYSLALKVVTLLSGLYFGLATWGMKGAAVALVASSALALAYLMVRVIRLLKPTVRQLVQSLSTGSLASLPFLVAGLWMEPDVSTLSIFGAMLAGLASAAIAYGRLRRIVASAGTTDGTDIRKK